MLITALSAIHGISFSGPVSAKDQISVYYAEMDAAILKKDPASMSNILKSAASPDYIYIEPDGLSQHLSKMIANIPHGLDPVDRFTTSKTRIDKIAVGSKSTVVHSTQLQEFITKPESDGTIHRFSDLSQNEDTWVKAKGRWMLKISKEKGHRQNGRKTSGL